MTMPAPETYPLTLKGELTLPPGRALWLIKWLLAIPHFIIIAFLAIAAVVAWVISLFAILFTGKYPRSLFDFIVGVMRWCWRVGFYSYEALGTDKYPPFTLQSVPDYPADLDVAYPEKLSQWLVLVKWWLLAFPHLIIVGILQGGGIAWRFNKPFEGWQAQDTGLLAVLVIIAGIILLFTGKYHEGFFKLIMGINRYVYRVGAYLALMTDKYPPFRFWD
ncbi:MAG: DUF4389 domain-containing protein [Dehalococcoidales bacterium]|nr:DUF4389 domain-containing protein [Dehalococcoidales bacterium]